MNSFALEKWDDEGHRCTFYSVRWEASQRSETDKFFDKHYALEAYKTHTQELLSFILDSVGEDHGAIDALFNRFENNVVGLPNKGRVELGALMFRYPNFPLRLYALRINNRTDLVVLYGGIKSAQTNQSSGELNVKWLEACQICKAYRRGIKK